MHTWTSNYDPYLDELIERSLAEDIGGGDLTTEALCPPRQRGQAYMVAKQPGVIAGLEIVRKVFAKLDAHLDWQPAAEDGARLEAGQKLVRFEASTRALLSGERLALNILQRLCGIASLTRRFVDAVAAYPVKILDTRKTTPGLRILEKYAVAAGGGVNHRMGLYDGIMIKDNHISLAGGISPAVAAMRNANPQNLPIEVETRTLAEVKEALHAGVDIIMLDNMSTAQMREAVELIDKRARIEASGGVTLQTVAEIAATGVDFISVGQLTHSAPALDISMYIA